MVSQLLKRVRPGAEEDNVVRLAPAPQPAKRPRDRRLDVFRGIALVMIFINHVPGTIFEKFTSRNFGFSDAAEAFVFISGCSAALAYAGGMSAPKLWPGISRMWGRAWTLYLVHLMITAWVIGICAAALHFGGDATMFLKDNVQLLTKNLTGTLVGLPLMMHQIGYVNILPMYAVLLLVGPALILAGMKAPRLTWAAAFLAWGLSGYFYLDLPNFPTPGGWFLNPLSWQVLFVTGLLTGLAIRQDRRLVPRHPALIAIAAAWLVFTLLWLKVPAVSQVGNQIVRGLMWIGLPRSLADFDKTYLSFPRLTHALALFYLMSALVTVRTICNSRWLEPLALMGRIALPVFALGTILSFAARAVKELMPASFALDAALIAAGCLAMWGFAWTLQTARAAAKG